MRHKKEDLGWRLVAKGLPEEAGSALYDIHQLDVRVKENQLMRDGFKTGSELDLSAQFTVFLIQYVRGSAKQSRFILIFLSSAGSMFSST